MQLTASLPALRRRDQRPQRTHVRVRNHPERDTALRLLARSKRSGGPEDRALYTCGCGYVFQAEVSTSVGCPHCGTSQAW